MLNLFHSTPNMLSILGLFMENKTPNIYKIDLEKSRISNPKKKTQANRFAKFNKTGKIPNKMITKFCYPEKL